MSDYLLHYWNLFHDFAEGFKGVVYKRIPLPLLVNFYKYLQDNMKERMRSPGFRRYLGMKINRTEEIGPAFDGLLGVLARPIAPNASVKNGVVLVNVDYLRFQAENYRQVFDRTSTLLIGRGGPPQLYDLPLLNIHDYMTDVGNVVQILEQRAIQIFETYRKHPVFGSPGFRTAFLQDIPRMTQYLVAAQKLYDSIPVSCVVVGTTEDLMSRVLVLTAAARGIPSVCLQHGLVMGEEAYLPAFATKTAVYGRYELAWYMNHGVRRDRIQVTGHPRYDLIRSRYPRDRRSLLEAIGLDGKIQTVLAATQPTGGADRWCRLIERLTAKSKCQIIVKPHPLEIGRGSAKDYKAALGRNPRVRVIEEHLDLNDWLAACDAAVVESSTVGLEAMLQGKPLFVLDQRLIDRKYEYYSGLDTFVMEDPVKLADRIAGVLSSRNKLTYAACVRKRFLKSAYPLSLSGPVLAKLIAELAGRGWEPMANAFEGQLVKGERDEVYVIENGLKRHIASVDVFEASCFQWEQVCAVDNRILDQIPSGSAVTTEYRAPVKTARNRRSPALNGMLVKGDGVEVYVLDRGLKRHIATEQIFERMRFDWGRVSRLDERILCRIPSGPFYG